MIEFALPPHKKFFREIFRAKKFFHRTNTEPFTVYFLETPRIREFICQKDKRSRQVGGALAKEVEREPYLCEIFVSKYVRKRIHEVEKQERKIKLQASRKFQYSISKRKFLSENFRTDLVLQYSLVLGYSVLGHCFIRALIPSSPPAHPLHPLPRSRACRFPCEVDRTL